MRRWRDEEPKPARAENPLGNTRRSAKAYLYLIPAFAVLAVFVVYPILMTLRMGFYQSYVYLTDTGTGFGLNSFRYVLQDPAFGLAVRNTMFIVLVGVPITIVLSLGAALLINSLLRTKGLFQTLYFLPYVTSTLAIGLVFRWLFHSEYGYINFFLEFLGLEPQKWLSDPNLTIVAVTILPSGAVWRLRLSCSWPDCKDRPAVLQGRPDRRHSSAPDILPHHHAPALPTF